MTFSMRHLKGSKPQCRPIGIGLASQGPRSLEGRSAGGGIRILTDDKSARAFILSPASRSIAAVRSGYLF